MIHVAHVGGLKKYFRNLLVSFVYFSTYFCVISVLVLGMTILPSSKSNQLIDMRNEPQNCRFRNSKLKGNHDKNVTHKLII